jgi:hypothetical protein
MTPFDYLARNYARNRHPDRFDMDEYWEDHIDDLRLFIVGARRMLQELIALDAVDLEVMEKLLCEHFEDDEVFFIAMPTSPEDIFGGGLLVQIRDGKADALAPVPCPENYRRKMSTIADSSEVPAMYSMAFRMLQEFHGRSPEMVMKLAPLLVQHLLDNYSPEDGIKVSFAEVVEFCDRMIAQGLVTLENIPFAFIQTDDEEENLEWIEEEDEQEEEHQQPPQKPPDDNLPF